MDDTFYVLSYQERDDYGKWVTRERYAGDNLADAKSQYVIWKYSEFYKSVCLVEKKISDEPIDIKRG